MTRNPIQHHLGPHADLIYGVLRVLAGALFAFHGMQKVLGVLAEWQPEVMSQLWIGGVIELVTGALIAIGLFTRWAAFVASGTMAVAYMQFHWKFRFGEHLIPTINDGEQAFVYCFLFLYIAARGPGRLSVGR
ncbi:MAG: DoxX family protein [Planctomycetes bacterium]|nr:DoxX family protein [Planctomycetota bacterium]